MCVRIYECVCSLQEPALLGLRSWNCARLREIPKQLKFVTGEARCIEIYKPRNDNLRNFFYRHPGQRRVTLLVLDKIENQSYWVLINEKNYSTKYFVYAAPDQVKSTASNCPSWTNLATLVPCRIPWGRKVPLSVASHARLALIKLTFFSQKNRQEANERCAQKSISAANNGPKLLNSFHI